MLISGVRAFVKLISGVGAFVKLISGVGAFVKLISGVGAFVKLISGVEAFVKLISRVGAFVKLISGVGAFVKLRRCFFRSYVSLSKCYPLTPQRSSRVLTPESALHHPLNSNPRVCRASTQACNTPKLWSVVIIVKEEFHIFGQDCSSFVPL